MDAEKQLMRESLTHTLSERLTAEHEAFLNGAGSVDFAEGLAAFGRGRPPRFTLPRIELELPVTKRAPGDGKRG